MNDSCESTSGHTFYRSDLPRNVGLHHRHLILRKNQKPLRRCCSP
ncbi:MAG: hypothetical protein ACJATF_004140, partial [Flavobacteriales bacterium]